MNLPSSLHSLSRPAALAESRPRRLPAWGLPLMVAASFALLFLILFRDRLLPATDVEVAVVLVARSEHSAGDGGNPNSVPEAMLFQASGWIEPDPFPIDVPALIDGVVEQVHVFEGERVKKGEKLMTLISEDARLTLAMAEQHAKTLRSARDAHLGAIAVAKERLAGAEAQTTAAAAIRDEAADRLRRFEKLPAGSVAELEVVASRLRAVGEESNYLAVTSAAGEAAAEIKRLELETRVKEDEIQSADLEVEKARLALARATITAPIDGRVLRLSAAPGQKKMLHSDEADSSTVAVLYDPGKLQVRVDVPLADAARLQVGQLARIRSAILQDRIFQGVVTRIMGEADLQRNTLQAKVRVLDPVDAFRPEMLCRVEFLESAAKESPTGDPDRFLSTWIPAAAIRGSLVWVCDPDSKRVSKREVKSAQEIRDGFVRIADGLRPGEWVVLSPVDLAERQRVNPTLVSP